MQLYHPNDQITGRAMQVVEEVVVNGVEVAVEEEH